MRKLLATLIVVASLASPRAALAWNGTGHMTVARIAYANLSDGTRAKIDALLRHHPDYAKFRAGLSAHDPDFGLIVFMRAATWPDSIKSDTRFFEDGGTPTTPLPGFPSMERHREWHFIDTPFSTDGTQTAEPPTPNAITELPRLISEIGNPSIPRNVQAYDLAWVIHLVGDLHQPLHATSRFTTRHGPPEGDRGGNLFLITVPGNAHIGDLHTFWDDLLGTGTSASFIKSRAAAATALVPPEATPDVTPQDWVDESFSAAKETVYKIGKDRNGDPRPHVSNAYNTTAHDLANRRIALAGYRLAAVLNSRLP